MKNRSQKGFAITHVLLLIITLAVVFGVGWYVYQSGKDKNDKKADVISSKSSTTKNAELLTLHDLIGNFSVKYPSTWKLKSSVSGSKADLNFASENTLSSPTGTILTLNTGPGGFGGACEPKPSDVPFKAGNECVTTETLSSEKLSVNNLYDKTGDGTGKAKLSEVDLVTLHLANVKGEPEYVITASSGVRETS